MDYASAVRETWRHSELAGENSLRELVRYATLAASSHNTQPWKFRLEPNRISIVANLGRRCPKVDPDDHHLYVSLGCATENLLVAAAAAGSRGEARFEALQQGGEVHIDLEKGAPIRSPLFEAIVRRQCSRAPYDGRPAPAEVLRQLEDAGRGEGVSVLLLTDPSSKDAVAEYVAEGNRAQIGDRQWVRELGSWIRFNSREALATRDGLYAKATGNPEVPRLFGDLFLRFAFSAKGQNSRDVPYVRGSAGVAVFVSERDDQKHWVEAGRCYQRFALTATALGLQNAFVNQPVEVERLRPQLASWLDLGRRRPDLLVRFGYGPEMPRSLRRSVDDVLA